MGNCGNNCTGCACNSNKKSNMLGKKFKQETVIRALMLGLPVELGGYKYIVGENDNGQLTFGMIATRQNLETIHLGADLDMTTFLRDCESLTDDDIAILVSQIVLGFTNG